MIPLKKILKHQLRTSDGSNLNLPTPTLMIYIIPVYRLTHLMMEGCTNVTLSCLALTSLHVIVVSMILIMLWALILQLMINLRL